MQQKVCARRTSLFTENGQACGASADPQLPFRCPRCGEHKRFRSLASLRAHLEYSHSYYHTMHELSLPTLRGAFSPERALHGRSLSDTREVTICIERCRMPSVGTQAADEIKTENEEEDDEEEEASKDGLKIHKSSPGTDHIPSPFPFDEPPDPGSKLEVVFPERNVCTEAMSLRHRLAKVLRAVDSTMQRRLHRVSTELAKTDTKLLCERALSQHLAQERQEVQEKERALSGQVDVAVMVIATLKEQLKESEYELERREQEVITIQNFLQAATHHEICGKVRIQRFIENLLKRIALAERLLEYYQSSPSPPNYTDYMHQTAENRPHRIPKSRSAGCQLSQACPQEGRTHRSQLGRKVGHCGYFRPDRRDEVLTQCSRSAGFVE
ncbi:LOW QUALITY PROTEIN: protein ZNF365-like [Salvelinus alpinus]|uniref:LOW QUALITY PROTEIN: protein ZNF365-like n=1 Tax=Salvelinus alpinus TaxID=8036 RepID=UPI0039FD11C7